MGVLGYADHVKYECVKSGGGFVAFYCLPERSSTSCV